MYCHPHLAEGNLEVILTKGRKLFLLADILQRSTSHNIGFTGINILTCDNLPALSYTILKSNEIICILVWSKRKYINIPGSGLFYEQSL